jgi:hypothetical protein
MKHYLLVASLAVAMTFFIAHVVAIRDCPLSDPDVARVVAGDPAGEAMPERTAFHCLIYGKYCLGDNLRSR